MEKLAKMDFNISEMFTSKPTHAVFSLAGFLEEKLRQNGYNYGAVAIIDNIYSVEWIINAVDKVFEKVVTQRGIYDGCPPWNM